jgi:hypothetical protein
VSSAHLSPAVTATAVPTTTVPTTTVPTSPARPVDLPPAGRWALANAAGLAVAMPLFGLVADGFVAGEGAAEKVAHLAGFAVAAAVLGTVQAAAAPGRSRRLAWIAADALALGTAFVAGYELVGPPVDFLLGFAALGLVAALLLRGRSLRSAVRGVVAGLAAGLAAVVPAILAGDAIDAAFGSGRTGFAAVLTTMGAIAGAVLGLVTRGRLAARAGR